MHMIRQKAKVPSGNTLNIFPSNMGRKTIILRKLYSPIAILLSNEKVHRLLVARMLSTKDEFVVLDANLFLY